jgi:hypothetical protein
MRKNFHYDGWAPGDPRIQPLSAPNIKDARAAFAELLGLEKLPQGAWVKRV